MDDHEIQALFEVEALERLGRLNELLLRLEVDRHDAELVAKLFREAHTLKGSADMVGLADIAAEADALESVLAELRAGTRPVDRVVVDELLGGLDRLSVLSGIPVHTPATASATPPAATPSRPPMANLAALLGGPGPIPEGAPLVERRRGPRGRRVTDGTSGLEELARLDHLDVRPAAAAAHPAGSAMSPSPPPSPAIDAPSVPRGPTARVAVDRLDDLVRLAGEAAAAHDQIVAMVRQHLGSDPFDLPEVRSLSRHLGELQETALRARMLPVGDLAPALRRAARDVARRTGKEVRFEIEGEGTELDRNVHERLADALVHVVRNAVDHGIEDPSARLAADKPETGTVTLAAAQAGSQVVLTITDDGRGVHLPAVRRRAEALGIGTDGLDDDEVLELLFRPAFSTASPTSDVSGRGVGLDMVRDTVAALRGRVEVTSEDGIGTTIRITVPTTLTVLRSVVVVAGGIRCALALHGVGCVLSPETGEVPVEGRAAVRVDQEIVPVAPLAPLLGRSPLPGGPIVVLRSGSRARALRVDAVLGQREVLVKALPRSVPANDLVVGASAEADGSVLLVLDVDAVVGRSEGVDVSPAVATLRTGAGPAAPARGRVLVVDDALTVRELQRTILERAGFEVRTASDGGDALARLAEAPADLVLSDIEMEGMDGLGLTRAIRDDARWRNLPVVLLTSRSSEDDRRRGLDAGADAYIVKSAFDERALLGIVDDLLGKAG